MYCLNHLHRYDVYRQKSLFEELRKLISSATFFLSTFGKSKMDDISNLSNQKSQFCRIMSPAYSLKIDRSADVQRRYKLATCILQEMQGHDHMTITMAITMITTMAMAMTMIFLTSETTTKTPLYVAHMACVKV